MRRVDGVEDDGTIARTRRKKLQQVQILNWNRDWCMASMQPLAGELDGELWLAFPDRKELELAREEWPGAAYAKATLTTLEDAAEVLSGRRTRRGARRSRARAEGLLGTSNLGANRRPRRRRRPRSSSRSSPATAGLWRTG